MPEPLELKTLVYDNTSGAREIAARSLQLLQQHATRSAAASAPELLDELADLGVKVLRSKPEMAPVFAAVNAFLQDAESREHQSDLGALRIELVAILQDHLRRAELNLAGAATHGAGLVHNGDVVLTLSRSSSVLAALRHAKAEGKVFDVVAAESRPNLEGRVLAKDLAADQVPVRLVVDGLVGTAVEGADLVLVGADAITSTNLVNKAGTRLLALAAREQKVPFHVVADLGKAWLKKADPTLSLASGKLRDPREVWDEAPYGVEVVNLYFDRTPLAWVTDIVCEAGPLAPSAFWDHVRGLGVAKRLRRAFDDELA